MKKSVLFSSGIAIIIGVVILGFGILLALTKFLWAWIVPDLFPGAVSAGLVVASISWMTAFKLTICISIIAGIIGSQIRQQKSCD